MTDIETLQKWLSESCRAVFFGGAGVSTESGIPDFRSVDGLYNQKYDEPPETILSHTYFTGRRLRMAAAASGKRLCRRSMVRWRTETISP